MCKSENRHTKTKKHKPLNRLYLLTKELSEDDKDKTN